MILYADTVLRLLETSPGSNVDDLLPSLPGYTRHQVMQALQNLAFRRKVLCERQGTNGRNKGAKPGRYWVIDKKAHEVVPANHARPAASVWEWAGLGARV